MRDRCSDRPLDLGVLDNDVHISCNDEINDRYKPRRGIVKMWRGKQQAHVRFSCDSKATRMLDFLGGSISCSFFKNRLTSIGSPVGGVDHRSTILTKPRSIHRMSMLSRSQTPVVQMARGPAVLSRLGASTIAAFSTFSLVDANEEPRRVCCFRIDCIRIRLAIRTSVKMRSPTMISSWSRIGD